MDFVVTSKDGTVACDVELAFTKMVVFQLNAGHTNAKHAKLQSSRQHVIKGQVLIGHSAGGKERTLAQLRAALLIHGNDDFSDVPTTVCSGARQQIRGVSRIHDAVHIYVITTTTVECQNDPTWTNWYRSITFSAVKLVCNRQLRTQDITIHWIPTICYQAIVLCL
jgi:hypothetical protein